MTAKQNLNSLHAPDGSLYITLTDGNGNLVNLSETVTSTNTIIGTGAGAAVTSGTHETFIGANAGAATSTQADVTAIGYNALAAATSGANNQNTAVGSGALSSLTSGIESTAVGYNTLSAVTTTGENTGVGWQAGKVYTGSNSTFFGVSAGLTLVSGDNCTIIGTDAFRNYVSGASNTVIGAGALNGSATGSGTSNTVIGGGAAGGGAATTAAQNVIIGAAAGNALVGGNQSALIGTEAGKLLTDASGVVAIGFQAGSIITNGGPNTVIGNQVAKTTLQTGTHNVLIGTSSSIDTAAGNTANTIQIGAGSTAVWSATGTGTPSTSATTVAGTATIVGSGAASVSQLMLNGVILTGGTGTTNFPALFVQPSGTTAATTWGTSGTVVGINLPSGFSGNILDVRANGGSASVFSMTSAGTTVITGSMTALNLRGSQNTSLVTLGASNDVILSRAAAASWQLGAADAAAPVAQTLRAQSVIAGTADTVGQSWIYQGSLSTGAGASGNMVFKTGGTGAASTVQNTAITALTITSGTTNNTNVGQPSIVIGAAAVATNATDGFLYIPTCAGTPTGTPTANTGRVPMIFDTTNSQFWFFTGGAWKQPKTPAGAALVTWQ